MKFDCLRRVVSEVPPDLVRDLGGKIRSLDKTLNKESKYVWKNQQTYKLLLQKRTYPPLLFLTLLLSI